MEHGWYSMGFMGCAVLFSLSSPFSSMYNSSYFLGLLERWHEIFHIKSLKRHQHSEILYVLAVIINISIFSPFQFWKQIQVSDFRLETNHKNKKLKVNLYKLYDLTATGS